MSGTLPPDDQTDDQTDDLIMIQAACRMLGIMLDPAWHASVLFNVRAIAAQSLVLFNPPLPDDVEPGPVFTA